MVRILNTFKKKLLYYGKDTLLNYTYVICCGILGFVLLSASMIEVFPGYVCSILSLANIALYIAVIRNAYYKTGEEAMRYKHVNDDARREMLRTREYTELYKVSEYNYKKYFIFLAPMVLPLIILLLISTGITIFGGNSGNLDAVIKIAYSFVYSFFGGINPSASVYFTLFAIPVMAGAIFLGYFGGVRKVKAEYAQVERLKEMVEGGKN